MNLIHNRKITTTVCGGILIGAVALSAFSCSSTKTETNADPNAANANKSITKAPPAKTNTLETNTKNMPKALTDAGEFAENIYDFAKAKDWKKAEERQIALEKSISELKAENVDAPQLVTATDSIKKAVASKNELDTMREANHATFLVADLTAKYNPKVPIEIVKLDYYGREIEIWSMAKDVAKLKSTAVAIRQTWNAVKPKLEAKGAAKVTAKFESLVAQSEKAISIPDYAKVATPILDEVDNLEKVFE